MSETDMAEKSRTEKLNEYARRVKAGEVLTPEEIADRDKLRQEYIEAFRKNFRAQLDNTVVQYPDGTKKSLTEKKSPKDIIKSMGMKQISDDATIRGIIVSILDAHQDLINEYHNGRSNVFDFFVGQVMKETKGRANPKTVNELIKSIIG